MIKSNHKMFIKNIKKQLRDAIEKQLCDYKINVLNKSYDYAVTISESYGYNEYSKNFRFVIQENYSFGQGNSIFSSTSFTINEAIGKVNKSYQQSFSLINVSTNPENGYPYTLNVEELGWKTVGFFIDKNKKVVPISAPHPFSPERAPKRILDDVALIIGRG